MAQYLRDMAMHGVSRDALRRMTQTLPAQLLGLEDAAQQHARESGAYTQKGAWRMISSRTFILHYASLREFNS